MDLVTPDAKPLLRVRQVSKRFASGTLALRDVSLDVGQHQFISLLGPSGCGKSTLLRLIAGLGQPSAGQIDWPTSACDARGLAQPELSFVFQEPTLMPWATARRNVSLPLRLAGMPARLADERACEALASMGLAGFEDAYPRELSGGMKMRVSIARGLVTRPRILLMDEPFAALDEITRMKLNHDLLALWQRERFSVVFVTHSVFESVYLSQRVVVLAARPGRIHADLDVAEPYPRPASYRTSAVYARHCERASAALESTLPMERQAA
ncbi:ABC transporter ATP-binding protein [Aquabacterium soli]|uniref:ABC transporter ATP-binding protein n=1 Tax=Aquabacterium soli TaxID=2493092 RepID=A0A3R8U7A5_9BURK|nr:ABC transporter ATP-binding protein [Aquabacterium soli]RRS06126.1 ABC transporter ATP-binding protein [Aquabacterium soli]